MTPTLTETIFWALAPIIGIAAIIMYNIKKQEKENDQRFGWTKEEKKIYKRMGRI